jgi:hypothetical protein
MKQKLWKVDLTSPTSEPPLARYLFVLTQQSQRAFKEINISQARKPASGRLAAFLCTLGGREPNHAVYI